MSLEREAVLEYLKQNKLYSTIDVLLREEDQQQEGGQLVLKQLKEAIVGLSGGHKLLGRADSEIRRLLSEVVEHLIKTKAKKEDSEVVTEILFLSSNQLQMSKDTILNLHRNLGTEYTGQMKRNIRTSISALTILKQFCERHKNTSLLNSLVDESKFCFDHLIASDVSSFWNYNNKSIDRSNPPVPRSTAVQILEHSVESNGPCFLSLKGWSGDDDSSFIIAASEKCLAKLTKHDPLYSNISSNVTVLLQYPTDNNFMAGTELGSITLHNTSNLAELCQYSVPCGVTSLGVSGDILSRFVSTHVDGQILLWDHHESSTTGRPIRQLSGSSDGGFVPTKVECKDANTIIVGGTESVLLYDLRIEGSSCLVGRYQIPVDNSIPLQSDDSLPIVTCLCSVFEGVAFGISSNQVHFLDLRTGTSSSVFPTPCVPTAISLNSRCTNEVAVGINSCGIHLMNSSRVDINTYQCGTPVNMNWEGDLLIAVTHPMQ